MKSVMTAALFTLITGLTQTLLAVEADVEGARPGHWTMDLAAAKQVAAEQQLPIMLNFSGSDWCGWCKLMEENVFSKPEWTAWATNNLMMVLVDFPQDKSLVPEQYVERNEALQAAYGVRGFPTFVILDQDGETELGRLSAGQEKTPESFQAELAGLLRNRAAEMEKFMESLSTEEQAAFKTMTAQLEEKTAAAAEQEALIEAATEKLSSIQTDIEALEKEIKLFRIAQQGEEKLAEYKALEAELNAATKDLKAWIETGPERNEKNTRIYEEKMSKIQSLTAEMDQF